jgi:Short-chain alcohol dehydrogenase of unknown specificity
MKINEVVAVVTGGASGIGETVAKYFAAQGAKVVIGDVVQEQIDRVVGEIKAAGGKAVGVKTDVTKDADVAALMDTAVTDIWRHQRCGALRGHHSRWRYDQHRQRNRQGQTRHGNRPVPRGHRGQPYRFIHYFAGGGAPHGG